MVKTREADARSVPKARMRRALLIVATIILVLALTVFIVLSTNHAFSGIGRSELAITSTTYCANGNIYVFLRNQGTEGVPLDNISVTVIGQYGGNVGPNRCSRSGSVLSPGKETVCDPVHGYAGADMFMVEGPANSASGSVYCLD